MSKLDVVEELHKGDVTKAMRTILKGSRKPKNLQTDAGKEFYNSTFKQLTQQHGINHYSTYSTKKASIVECVIRTIKEKLYKEFSLQGSYKWLDILPRVIDEYNNTLHRTVRMKPRDVTHDKEKQLLETVYNNIKIQGSQRFKIGDIVRISKHKSLFDKGYTPNWSSETDSGQFL
ncbi:hypothetical protein QE152_g1129 [Popillia japonica]|uniref:Integrase catalytic domain-containing protein n=1 Tax=Popillia japonica TaxID=7064 RepID=A0AAW1N7Z2_POPJA